MTMKTDHRAGYHRSDRAGRENLVVHQRHSRVERRSGSGDDSPSMIRGYGAVYYREGDESTEYWLWDDIVERIRPGAFDRSIAEQQDVRGLFNHDPNQVLGRTASGTMRLRSDAVGLAYEIDDDPNSPMHVNIGRMIDRGDVSGSSFWFRPSRVSWTETDDYAVRWIEDVDLYDVGPVTFPAYDGASSGRSADAEAIVTELANYRTERNAAEAEPYDIAIAARLASLPPM
ncbi:Caudovirus prohead protease [Rosistilla carotiformis]|uniref:Caudovirus prohead protease n=1 Tax=Rosistilla carotiformis TaxID=2528017 RepID=A0A518JNR1_9BACT|nr:HK97 family phage prohead protease [Rosistilla carotiformis]QDV67185.1 Caudovirus prohead protease [Rosistilla carotiformis]